MHSMQIGDMVNGFHDEAAEPGYQKRGAVLLEGAEMLQLPQRMKVEAGQYSPANRRQWTLPKLGMTAVALYATAGNQAVTNFLTTPLDNGTKVYSEKGMTSNGPG
ncbi:TPA: hypothetical protein ACH3X1_016216 [Trebouxia sp. C0004]